MNARSIVSAVCGQIKCFFVQTFRRHTGAEYSEFLTRGVRSGDKGVQRAYPWFYIRLFAACMILFAVYLSIVRFTSNPLFTPVTVIIAALAFNAPFLVLLYEIYPRNDVSLLSVFVTLLVGGTGACVLAQILYALIPASNAWLNALRSAGVEEFSKAAAAIVAIAALRVKQPLVGFLMGAAVGCGFSVVEDAGYIFMAANDLPGLNISATLEQFAGRGASALCTHTVWTAAAGWAFASARRPFLSVRLYACFAGSAALHFLWNSPLTGGAHAGAVACCAVVAAAFGIAVLAYSRRAAFRAAGEAPTPEFFHTDEGALRRDRRYYVHAGHLSLTFGAFLMALIAVIYCSVPFRETYYSQTFYDSAQFVSFMQGGRELSRNFSRPYDELAGNEEENRTDGVLTSVTQVVCEDGLNYYYTYTVAGDENVTLYLNDTVSVELTINGVTSRYFREDAYTLDGRIYASYFRVRSDVTGYTVSADGSSVTVIMYDPAFRFDYSQPQYLALFAVLGAMAALSVGLYVIFYILARRKKDVE